MRDRNLPVCTGPWFADYGMEFKDEEGNRFVCIGFSRGPDGVFNRLMNLETGKVIEARFVALCISDDEKATIRATLVRLNREDYMHLMCR